MSTEQAAQIIELLEAHLSWAGIWAGFGIGFGLSGTLLVYRAARKTVEEIEE